MKYPARFYSQALTSLIEGGQAKEAQKIIDNLIVLLRKNGDLRLLPEIIERTERALARTQGGRSVRIETARPLPHIRETLRGILTPHDVVEERVNPSLIAGLTITIDGETQIDASLRSQLDSLFASHS